MDSECTTFPSPTLPVPDPTQSFWTNSPGANALADHGSRGVLTSDADICIIGSGITGISAAHALSRSSEGNKRPLSVIILEAREFCSGATGRNGGHLHPNTFISFVSRAHMHGVCEAKRTIALEKHTTDTLLHFIHSGNLEHALDLVSGGVTVLASTPAEMDSMRRDFEAAKKEGVDGGAVRFVTQEEMIKEYGAPYPAVQCPGHNLWPLKLVTQLYYAAAASRLTLTLHTHTAVTSVTPLPSLTVTGSTALPRRYTIHTARGNITCTSILHATNAYAPYLLPCLYGPRGIVPTRGQVVGLRAENNPMRVAAWRANEDFEYWFARPRRDEIAEKPFIILGGGRDCSHSDPPLETYIADDSTVNKEVGIRLRTFLADTMPRTGNVVVEWEWTGIMGFTAGGDPFVGPVLPLIDREQPGRHNYQGQFVSAGYTGHGMPRAYGCAEVVVMMMIHELGRLREGSATADRNDWEKMELPEWFPRRFLTWRHRS